LKLSLRPPNPIESEDGAFGFLVWFVAVVVVILAIVGILQLL
jgi:hypothetical protein